MEEVTDTSIKCYICDKNTVKEKSYSIFDKLVPETLQNLSECIETLFSLKKINEKGLRSKYICVNCYDCLINLRKCYNKLIELKCNFWDIYKRTCENYGEDYCDNVLGASTQTHQKCEDSLEHCDSLPLLGIKCKVEKDGSVESGNYEEDPTCDDELGDIKPAEASEEITIEADLDIIRMKNDISLREGGHVVKRRPESCKICGKWFRKICELDNHMLIHSSEDRQKVSLVNYTKKKLSCSVCNKKFNGQNELKEHASSHKNTHPFSCKLCGKHLRTKPGAHFHAIRVHKVDVTKDDKFEDYFGLVGENSDGDDDADDGEVKNDVTTEEDEADMLDSVVVDEASSSSEDELPLARRRKEFIFEKIKKKIITEKPVKTAPVRQQKTIQKLALQTLKKSCEISVTKVCKTSNNNNKLEGEFVRPLKIKLETNKVGDDKNITLVVKNINDEQIRSKIADLSKTNEVTIQNKNSDKLSNDSSGNRSGSSRPQRKFSLNTLLKLKKQKDAGLLYPSVREAKFECDICHKMWKSRGELNAHKQTHSDARPYICEICGQAYKHKPALDVHVGMHRGIYQHQCPYCQKAFTQKGALQRHLPIHTGDLPYQCELCGKRFVHRTSFSIHTMAHTGVRNIRCKVCNLGVLSKSHLRRHMRIHTGEKPYECQTCGKAFAERYNLVAHQRIHDPNLVGPARQQKRKVQTCRLCNMTFERRHKLEDHMVTAHNKVVDDPARAAAAVAGSGSGAFEVEGYTNSSQSVGAGNRPGLEISYRTDVVRKVSDVSHHERDDDDDDKPAAGLAEQHVVHSANDLSVKNMQMRNWEILRNFENTRSLELIRMANGVDDALRLPGGAGPGSGSAWGYVNPNS